MKHQNSTGHNIIGKNAILTEDKLTYYYMYNIHRGHFNAK